MPNKPVAVVAVQLEPELQERIKAVADVTFIPPTANNAEVLPHVANAEGVLVSNQMYADANFFAGAPNLRVLAGVGVGYDRCDVSAATELKIAVCNTPGVLTGSVADLTIGSIYMLTKRMLDHAIYAREGRWGRREPQVPLGNDATGKLLGIVGYGRIGREVARRAQALGMKTAFYDLFTESPEGAPKSPYMPLDQLLAESDIVTLHVDLNAETRHMISTPQLELMKPSAYLINTSRGPVVDQVALCAAMKAGRIQGAALDVLELEPPLETEEICTLPNVLVFPHMATATVETRYLMRELAADNLISVLTGKMPKAIVNPQVLG